MFVPQATPQDFLLHFPGGCHRQFVHEDDVVEAMSRLLLERKAGIFNLTADGTIKLSEAAAIAGLKTRNIPYKVQRRIAGAMWKLRLRRSLSLR